MKWFRINKAANIWVQATAVKKSLSSSDSWCGELFLLFKWFTPQQEISSAYVCEETFSDVLLIPYWGCINASKGRGFVVAAPSRRCISSPLCPGSSVPSPSLPSSSNFRPAFSDFGPPSMGFVQVFPALLLPRFLLSNTSWITTITIDAPVDKQQTMFLCKFRSCMIPAGFTTEVHICTNAATRRSNPGLNEMKFSHYFGWMQTAAVNDNYGVLQQFLLCVIIH